MGEDAILRGTVGPIRVNIQRDVEMSDQEGNVMFVQFVARLPSAVSPEKNDTLAVTGQTINAGNYVLETRLDDDGYFARFILRKV